MNKKPTKNMSIRSHIAFLGFALFLLVLIGNLFWPQIVKGEEYRLKAERNQLSDTIVNAHRGTIYDSNMKIIAQSASAWLVYINGSDKRYGIHHSRMAYDTLLTCYVVGHIHRRI